MRAVLRFYPPLFRDRYGDEIALLLESSPTPRRDLMNVFWHALLDRTEYTMTLTWRRAPRYLGFLALSILAVYAFGFLFDKARGRIVGLVLDNHFSTVPIVSSLFWMRVMAALCLAAVSVAVVLLGRRFGRGTPWFPVAALVLASVVTNLLGLDGQVLSHLRFSVDWPGFAWQLLRQVFWIGAAALLLYAIRRAGRPAVVAAAGVVAVAYAYTAVDTVISDALYQYPGNALAAYWENILGTVFLVTGADGHDFIGVFGYVTNQGIVLIQSNGWWPTIATALVAGWALAARRSVPTTAHSPELAS